MTATIADLQAVERLIKSLPEDKLVQLEKLPGVAYFLEKRWLPNPGPQTDAYHNAADEIFYGGEAGGGKTELLMGLAYTAHKSSLLLGRTNKEASRFIRRFAEIVGHRDGWSGQLSTFSLPNNQTIEFGGCQLEEDKQKFKGEPKDLICVGRGTPVLLANGTYCPVEHLSVGVMLATLEGPRRLERLYPPRRKQCVEVTARSAEGGLLARQVHSGTHALLFETDEFWVGGQDDVYASKLSHDSDKPSQLSPERCSFSETLPLKTTDRSRHMGEWFRQFSHLQPDWVKHAYAVLSSLGTCFSEFVCDNAKMQRLLLEFSPAMPAWRRPQSEVPFEHRPAFSRDGVYGRGASSHEGFQPHYSAGSHLRGEHTQNCSSWRTASNGDRGCLLLSSDVGPPIPTHSPDGVRGKTHKHRSRTSMYVHPYTREIRPSSMGLISASLEVVPVGVREVFDIQVEEVRHYITKGGFVNKNCFDEIADSRRANIVLSLAGIVLRTRTSAAV